MHVTPYRCPRRNARLLLQALLGCRRRRAVRVLDQHGFQRRFNALDIALLLLASRNVDQRIRCFRILRPPIHNNTVSVDGLFAIVQRVVGVTKPILGIRRQTALRISFHKRIESPGRFLHLIGFKQIERSLVVTCLGTRIFFSLFC